MSRTADLGATILPPMPSFYHGPQTIQDIINQSIGKVLDQFSIEHNLFRRWKGDERVRDGDDIVTSEEKVEEVESHR